MQPVLPVGQLPEGMPMDGMEYLALCRQEAALIPDLMVARIERPAATLEPTNFEYESSNNDLINPISIELKPCQEWVNQRLMDFKILAKSKNVRRDLEKKQMNQSLANWKLFFNSNKPRLLPLNQRQILKLLNSFLACDIERSDIIWIYGLLARLDPLLEADDEAMLRELMKKVRTCRPATMDEYFVGCTLIIVIIGHVFGQRDLLD